MVWLQFCLFVLSWLLCPFLNLGLWIFFISSRARMTLLPWQVFLYMLDLQVQFPKIFPVDGKHAFLCFNYLGFCYLFLSPLQGCRSPLPPTIFPGHIPFVYPQEWCPWPKTVNSLFHAHLESITGTLWKELPFMEKIYVQCWSAKASCPLPFIDHDRSGGFSPVWECELTAELCRWKFLSSSAPQLFSPEGTHRGLY